MVRPVGASGRSLFCQFPSNWIRGQQSWTSLANALCGGDLKVGAMRRTSQYQKEQTLISIVTRHPRRSHWSWHEMMMEWMKSNRVHRVIHHQKSSGLIGLDIAGGHAAVQCKSTLILCDNSAEKYGRYKILISDPICDSEFFREKEECNGMCQLEPLLLEAAKKINHFHPNHTASNLLPCRTSPL